MSRSPGREAGAVERLLADQDRRHHRLVALARTSSTRSGSGPARAARGRPSDRRSGSRRGGRRPSRCRSGRARGPMSRWSRTSKSNSGRSPTSRSTTASSSVSPSGRRGRAGWGASDEAVALGLDTAPARTRACLIDRRPLAPHDRHQLLGVGVAALAFGRADRSERASLRSARRPSTSGRSCGGGHRAASSSVEVLGGATTGERRPVGAGSSRMRRGRQRIERSGRHVAPALRSLAAGRARGSRPGCRRTWR